MARIDPQRSRILKYVRDYPGRTATEIAKALGLSASSVSGFLVNQVNFGSLIRRPGRGKRGGYGYFFPKGQKPEETQSVPTSWQRLVGDDVV